MPVIAQVAKEEGTASPAANEDDVVAGIGARTVVSLPVKALVSRGDPDTFVVSYAGPRPTRPSASPTGCSRCSSSAIRQLTAAGEGRRPSSANSSATASAGWTRSRRVCAVLRNPTPACSPIRHSPTCSATSDIRQRSDHNAEALARRARPPRHRRTAARSGASAKSLPTRATEDEVKADDRVATLERQLAEAQRSYTAKHPEIQRLEAQLATARIEQAQARTQASTANRAAAEGRPDRRPAHRAIATACARASASCRRSRAACRRSWPPTRHGSTRRRSSSSSWRRSSRPTSSRRRSTSGWPSATSRR